MFKSRKNRKKMLSVFITLLFIGSIATVLAPVMAETPAPEPAPAPEPTAETGSRAPETCINSGSGWSMTGTHTYTGTCTISGGSITVQSGADITFEAITLTHSGSYYFYIYGTLRILNSTVKGASTSWRGLLGQSTSPLIKIEASTISTFMYYGVRGYYTSKFEIGNSTFDGANVGNYGIYCYMVSGGYIDNNTVKRTDMYGIYIYQSSSVEVTYNAVQNHMGNYYPIYLYYFAGLFENNTVNTGNSYSVYIRYTPPYSFRHNTITNGRGLYLYRAEMDAWDCDISGNTGNDVTLVSSPGKLRAYNTKFSTSSVASGTSIEVYWRANVSAEWLSDGSAVDNAQLTITDGTDVKDDRDLFTDANGEVKGIYLMEYSQESSGKKDRNPYWINATVDLAGQAIYNSSQLDVGDSPNNVKLVFDDVPPWLTVTAPEDGLITNQTQVTVTGKTEKNLSAEWPIHVEVKVGTKTYDPVVDGAGSFEQVVSLTKEGSHDIEVRSYDFVYNEIVSTISVIRDTVKPSLTIDEPLDETLTNIPTITVAGTTESGATLFVNDEAVTVDATGEYSAEVGLSEGDNTLTVKVKDLAENWNQVSVVVKLDTKAPILLIAEPLADLRTNEQIVRVLGTTEQKAKVMVNDKPVILAGTSFQTQITLEEGDNVITIESCDTAGNCNVTITNVFLDTIPPPLVVTSPEDGFLTNTDEVEVTGTTEAGADVTVNGRDADLFGTDWSMTFKLREGKNTIKVEAKDDVGNKATATLIVKKDTKPPVLFVTSPEDGEVFNDPLVRLEGNTEVGAFVTVNGEDVNLVSDTFTTQVKLKEGDNEIKVTAMDLAGNIAEETLTINLDTTVNLKVNDLDPVVTLETTDKFINISGEADKDAKVYVNEYYAMPDKNGFYNKEIELEMGENLIKVEAMDPLGNTVTQTFTVVRNEPPPPTTPDNPMMAGSGSLLGGLLVPLILLIVIIVVIIVVVAMMSKKKAASRKAEEEAATAAAAQEQQAPQEPIVPNRPPAYVPGQATYVPPPTTAAPEGQYTSQPQNGYGSFDQGPAYAGSAPAVATAHAIPSPPPPPPGPEPISNVTPEAQRTYQKAEQAISEAEAAGRDMTKNKRHIKIAQMFISKGNSEKVIHYSRKAMDFD